MNAAILIPRDYSAIAKVKDNACVQSKHRSTCLQF